MRVKLISHCAQGAALLTVLAMPVAPVYAQEIAVAPTELETVVVTGTRTEKLLDESPIRIEVVTQEEIKRTNAKTLKEALENVPGLQLKEIHGKSGYEVSLQGLTSDQVLVLVDGLPVSASTGSTVDLSQYTLATVDHIEVVKGAASAQYGSSAMGGVINVITRRIEQKFSGEASADVGSYGKENVTGKNFDVGSSHAQLRAEGGTETLRLRASGDFINDRGFAIDPSSFTRQGDAMLRKQYALRTDWLPAKAGEFWAEANRYAEDDTQRYQVFAPPNYVPQKKTEAITRNRYAGGGQWRWQSGLRFQLKGLDEHYASHSQERSNGALVGDRYSSQATSHVTSQVDLPSWYSQLWQFGIDWHRETLAQTSNGVSELTGNGSTSRASREVFAQNDVMFDETWELLIGARYQDDSDFGGHAAPKASLRAHLLRDGSWDGTLRASVGQGYRVPNLKERHYLFDHSSLGYMVIGNPDLKPESSNSWQLGGTLSWHERVSADVNFFLNNVRDLIQTDMSNVQVVNGVSIYTYRNVSRARTGGVETALRWRATDALTLSTAYTFTDTRDYATGGELTYRPKGIARLSADWVLPTATTLTLRCRYQSSELTDSDSGARSPAWTTVDVAVSQDIGHGFGAFAGVDNLSNRQRDFSDSADFGPISGRYFYLGARYGWGVTKH